MKVKYKTGIRDNVPLMVSFMIIILLIIIIFTTFYKGPNCLSMEAVGVLIGITGINIAVTAILPDIIYKSKIKEQINELFSDINKFENDQKNKNALADANFSRMTAYHLMKEENYIWAAGWCFNALKRYVSLEADKKSISGMFDLTMDILKMNLRYMKRELLFNCSDEELQEIEKVCFYFPKISRDMITNEKVIETFDMLDKVSFDNFYDTLDHCYRIIERFGNEFEETEKLALRTLKDYLICQLVYESKSDFDNLIEDYARFLLHYIIYKEKNQSKNKTESVILKNVRNDIIESDSNKFLDDEKDRVHEWLLNNYGKKFENKEDKRGFLKTIGSNIHSKINKLLENINSINKKKEKTDDIN